MNEENKIKVPPAYSYADIAKKRFNTLPFEGDWLDLIGEPEVSGSWIIWGLSGNGKTRFALKLAKYLASFQKVFYNTLEEGLKLSFRKALEANNMQAVGSRFKFYSDNLEQLKARLRRDRSPNIIFIDSVQYLNITKDEFKELLKEFQNKLFIFISHAQGSQPKGEVADEIRYHSDVKIRVHKFLASPAETTRYGGSKPMIIWDEGYRQENSII
ncbi:AAA family ATPase [Riemerella columbipharyngis]|uniref:ATPase family associated with various cellular activities (AAA) n=1 Tax=Riemerella columbipharyngis TaxID=1071918 RepID=A0A1G7FBV5_9FLAO|nr:AAA family ATPase [Riemerella columbipharyngis]SDE73361.1 ATPase family associated with various cellular activities (AAA) [Riemerella columbipharyngis]